MEQDLRRYPITRMVNERLVIPTAQYYRFLRDLEITVRRTIDTIIRAFRIEEGHSLRNDNWDFIPVANHLGLRVV